MKLHINVQKSLKKLLNGSLDLTSSPEMFLGKDVLKICSKFTGEHPCRSMVSIKLLCNFIEIALQHGYSPANMQHIFRTPFPRNASGWLLGLLGFQNWMMFIVKFLVVDMFIGFATD